MIAGSLVALVLAALAAAFLLAPLLRRDAAAVEERSATLSRARELQARQEQLVAALKDLEDDRATGKIDDADYTALEARLSAEAIEVMRMRDLVDAEHEAAQDAARRASRPLAHPAAKRPDPSR